MAGRVSQTDVRGGEGISIVVVNQFKHIGHFKHNVKPWPKSLKWLAICFSFLQIQCQFYDKCVGHNHHLHFPLQQNFLNSSSCPEIQGFLHVKELGRKSWKKLYVCLRRSGLYCSTKGTSKVRLKKKFHITSMRKDFLLLQCFFFFFLLNICTKCFPFLLHREG